MQEIILKLLLATFLGALVGMEREFKRKGAGLRTFSLVCLGSCIFTILTFQLPTISLRENFPIKFPMAIDPTRVIQAIAAGIGFIGAGVIFHQTGGVVGLTTAAGLWVVSAIGVAVGFGFYFLGIISTILSIIVFFLFAIFEEKFLKTKQ